MTSLTSLQCQNCAAQLDRDNQQDTKFHCKYCGSLFLVEIDKNSDNDTLTPRTSLKVIKPDHLDVNKNAGSISFAQKWRKKGSFILLAMAIIWIVVITSQIIEVMLEGANASLLILLLFFCVGLLLLHRAVSELLNISTLIVNKQTVSLKTKPISWKADFSHPMHKIKYFEILPPVGPSISPSTRTYRICAITDDDRRLTLMDKIKHPGHALYILRETNQLANK